MDSKNIFFSHDFKFERFLQNIKLKTIFFWAEKFADLFIYDVFKEEFTFFSRKLFKVKQLKFFLNINSLEGNFEFAFVYIDGNWF